MLMKMTTSHFVKPMIMFYPMRILQPMSKGGKHVTPGTRKNQILAAADLVLIEVGIERLTIDLIVEKAGIAKGTVYNYYKSKDEVLTDLSVKALTLLYEAFKKDAGQHPNSVDKLSAICMSNYRYYLNYPEYYKLVSFIERPEFGINANAYRKLSLSFQNFVQGIIKTGQKKGEISTSLNPVDIANVIWASCIGVVQFVDSKKDLLKNPNELDAEEFIRTFSTMVTRGIIA